MSYYDKINDEFMVAVLSHYKYPCLPIYEVVEDITVGNEINTYVKK